MPDQDVFTNEQPTTNTPETPAAAPTDPFADKLSAITNEQGEPKYKDVDTALAALKESQEFIEKLKQEKAAEAQAKAEAEAKLAQMGSIDDFVKRVSPNAQPTEKVETPQTPTGLSEEKVQELLQKQLEQRDAQSQQSANLAKVTEHLTGMFGDKTSTAIQQKAKELGTTTDELRNLSRNNPAMVIALFGNTAKSTPSPSQSSVNLGLTKDSGVKPPEFEKGATRGGMTNEELVSRFKQSRDYTNQRIGVET